MHFHRALRQLVWAEQAREQRHPSLGHERRQPGEFRLGLRDQPRVHGRPGVQPQQLPEGAQLAAGGVTRGHRGILRYVLH